MFVIRRMLWEDSGISVCLVQEFMSLYHFCGEESNLGDEEGEVLEIVLCEEEGNCRNDCLIFLKFTMQFAVLSTWWKVYNVCII